jgi:hypothetical protein
MLTVLLLKLVRAPRRHSRGTVRRGGGAKRGTPRGRTEGSTMGVRSDRTPQPFTCISPRRESASEPVPAAHTDQEKTALQRQIAETDRRVDRLVYDLYDLTDDEIRIVEGTSLESAK